MYKIFPRFSSGERLGGYVEASGEFPLGRTYPSLLTCLPIDGRPVNTLARLLVGCRSIPGRSKDGQMGINRPFGV